jgi:hypothetical protein
VHSLVWFLNFMLGVGGQRPSKKLVFAPPFKTTAATDFARTKLSPRNTISFSGHAATVQQPPGSGRHIDIILQS